MTIRATTAYDALSLTAPGTCCNCETKAPHLIRGRCRRCHEYRLKYHLDRPARLWEPVAPVWGTFNAAEEAGPDGHTWCDCGQVATQTLTVPISGHGKATLLLCDACAALERRLAPSHSWKGG